MAYKVTILVCPDCNRKFRTRTKRRYGLCEPCKRQRRRIHALHFAEAVPLTAEQEAEERLRRMTHRVVPH